MKLVADVLKKMSSDVLATIISTLYPKIIPFCSSGAGGSQCKVIVREVEVSDVTWGGPGTVCT